MLLVTPTATLKAREAVEPTSNMENPLSKQGHIINARVGKPPCVQVSAAIAFLFSIWSQPPSKTLVKLLT